MDYTPLLVSEQVRLKDAIVVGYSFEYNQPVLHMNAGAVVTLAQAQRAFWDRRKERYTEKELLIINKAVLKLKEEHEKFIRMVSD